MGERVGVRLFNPVGSRSLLGYFGVCMGYLPCWRKFAGQIPGERQLTVVGILISPHFPKALAQK